MQFVLARATRKKTKYYPRHFYALSDYFGAAEWLDSINQVVPGSWAIAVRSPGYHGLGRTTAHKLGIDCAFDLLDDEELAAVAEKDGSILVDLGWEILNPAKDVVVGIAKTLASLAIDPTRVFIFHSNQNAREQFNLHWLENVATQPPYTLEYPVAMALCMVHQQKHRDDGVLRERAEQAKQRTLNGSRSRLFVSFNGEVRPHRLYVAAALSHFNLLSRGYFSLVYPRKSAKESVDQFRTRTLGVLRKLARGDELVAAGARILEMLPMELDLGEIPPGGIEDIAWISQDPAYYDDSRFALVVDTTVSDSTCLFVTEKVIKPIMNHSPFLLVGSPGGANLLRSYGFKTFEPYLRQCETGGIEDVLQQAVEEVLRLSRLSEAELDTFSRSLAAICDHNAKHFWTVLPELLRRRFQECLLALGPAASTL